MKKNGNGIEFSASDLMKFSACEHATALDLLNLKTPLESAPADPSAELLRKKGYQHEATYKQQLLADGYDVCDLSEVPYERAAEAARQAMREGREIIFQARLENGRWGGIADFLRCVDGCSNLGDYRYEPVDTKLARRAKPEYLLQLPLYSEMLAAQQGELPDHVHIVLGNNTEKSFRLSDYIHYFRALKARFENFTEARPYTYPLPCTYCDFCDWRERCEAQWVTDDHLSRVANIRQSQIAKLNAAGVDTVRQLAKRGKPIPKLHPETQTRLNRQARLQVKGRELDEPCFESLPLATDAGFNRLPRPDPGDLFFDMEGDPLIEDGLEYLFGVYWLAENETPQFKAFWAHSRAEEKLAFENFVDFAQAQLEAYPDAHIYHYAHYERTALTRLMGDHGSREAIIDGWLRGGKLVDLYQVVRQGIVVSEPSYSIKNIEHFYMPTREEAVTSAADSIVMYEKWLATGDGQILHDIQDYNEQDCRSTYLLREWLLRIRPAEAEWHEQEIEERAQENASAHEKLLAEWADKLGIDSEPPESPYTLTWQLLGFHKRAAKPAWWQFFSRPDIDIEELVDDAECLADLSFLHIAPPEGRQRDHRYVFAFPQQEFKYGKNTVVHLPGDFKALGTIVDLNRSTGKVALRVKRTDIEVEEVRALLPQPPLNTKVLEAALLTLARSLAAEDTAFPAVQALLTRALPELSGRQEGAPLTERAEIPWISVAVAAMRESCLVIQGPPGTGKTYTSSHVIADLIADGKRIGVSSNSHKAINNLMLAVAKRAEERNMPLAAIKKSSAQNTDSEVEHDLVENTETNDISPNDWQLVGGTAWLFARDEFAASLDFLFIDEAGQVPLANVAAMGLSAQNIVLVGDQMQLPCPIQGTHPGRSGESVLDYLLDGAEVIRPERGIFLPLSYRMHPDVCGFVSDAFYQGELRSAPTMEKQKLLLKNPLKDLPATGIHFEPVEHKDNAQSSVEEAERVSEVYTYLLKQKYQDVNGKERPITAEDILVISPYNAQVNLLIEKLPEGARVGTVDKFQGQEAQLVIVSMATSGGDLAPRGLGFLFNRNRLNVAISRARCLAVIVACPMLSQATSGKVDEMRLVNGFCWLQYR